MEVNAWTWIIEMNLLGWLEKMGAQQLQVNLLGWLLKVGGRQLLQANLLGWLVKDWSRRVKYHLSSTTVPAREEKVLNAGHPLTDPAGGLHLLKIQTGPVVCRSIHAEDTSPSCLSDGLRRIRTLYLHLDLDHWLLKGILKRVLVLVYNRVLLKGSPCTPEVTLSLHLYEVLKTWLSQSPPDVWCHQLSGQLLGKFSCIQSLAPLKDIK